jgi:hypothetical protein
MPMAPGIIFSDMVFLKLKNTCRQTRIYHAWVSSDALISPGLNLTIHRNCFEVSMNRRKLHSAVRFYFLCTSLPGATNGGQATDAQGNRG